MHLLKLLVLIAASEKFLTGRLWARHLEWSHNVARKIRSKVPARVVRRYIRCLLVVEVTRWRFAAELALEYGDVAMIRAVGQSIKDLAEDTKADREYFELGEAIEDNAEQIIIHRHWSYRL